MKRWEWSLVDFRALILIFLFYKIQIWLLNITQEIQKGFQWRLCHNVSILQNSDTATLNVTLGNINVLSACDLYMFHIKMMCEQELVCCQVFSLIC